MFAGVAQAPDTGRPQPILMAPTLGTRLGDTPWGHALGPSSPRAFWISERLDGRYEPHVSLPSGHAAEWSRTMESNPRVWITVLRHSHERLLGLVGPLAPEQISGPSYCRDW